MCTRTASRALGLLRSWESKKCEAFIVHMFNRNWTSTVGVKTKAIEEKEGHNQRSVIFDTIFETIPKNLKGQGFAGRFQCLQNLLRTERRSGRVLLRCQGRRRRVRADVRRVERDGFTCNCRVAIANQVNIDVTSTVYTDRCTK